MPLRSKFRAGRSDTTCANARRGKPKTLFETASSKKIASAKGTLSFADIPKQKPEDIPMKQMASTAEPAQEQDPVFARDLNTSPVFASTPTVQEAQQQQAARSPEDPTDPERGAREDDEMEDA